jgi:uracil-DNA glycosylase
MVGSPRELSRLVREIRACRICADILEPNPVLQVSRTARLLVASQAPGLRVHQTGLTFNDASGDRLRDWMGVDRATFYDLQRRLWRSPA